MVKRWQQANPERVNENHRRNNARPERKRALRDQYYRRTFGISADDFDALLAEQGGGCAICGQLPDRAASLHLDHCHDTGAIRGILCLSCNQGLGKSSGRTPRYSTPPSATCARGVRRWRHDA
jgi:hypothetical protein